MCKAWQNNLASSAGQIILVTKQLFYRSASRSRTDRSWDQDGETERLLVEERMYEINAEHLWKTYLHMCALSSGPWRSIPVLCLCGSRKAYSYLWRCAFASKAKPPTDYKSWENGAWVAWPFAAHHVHLNTSICCWLPLVLQLASHGITGVYSATILFSLPSCLSACGLAQ